MGRPKGGKNKTHSKEEKLALQAKRLTILRSDLTKKSAAPQSTATGVKL